MFLLLVCRVRLWWKLMLPAGTGTGTAGHRSVSRSSMRWLRRSRASIPQRWVPGTKRRQPLSRVASSIAVQAVTRSMGKMSRQEAESWCHGCAEPVTGDFMNNWSPYILMSSVPSRSATMSTTAGLVACRHSRSSCTAMLNSLRVANTRSATAVVPSRNIVSSCRLVSGMCVALPAAIRSAWSPRVATSSALSTFSTFRNPLR